MVWSEHHLHFPMILSVLPCMCQLSKTEAVQGLIPQPLSPELSPPTSLLPTFKLYSNCIHLGPVLTKSITVARGHGIPLKGLSQPRPTFEAEGRGVGSVPFKMLCCFIMEEWWDMQGKKSEMSTLWLKKQKLPWVGISLVVQWLRICLPMQGMKVRSLVGEPKSHTQQWNQPAHHNYWAHVLQSPCSTREAHILQ